MASNLTEADFIRFFYAQGITVALLAEWYGKDTDTIKRILNIR